LAGERQVRLVLGCGRRPHSHGYLIAAQFGVCTANGVPDVFGHFAAFEECAKCG
jgi:hypothetical protein